MSHPKFTPFESILIRSQNEIGTAVLLLLSWIAASDGNIDQSEQARLRLISDSTGHGAELESLMLIASKSDLDALQLAAEIVRIHYRNEKAILFMQMAIGIAIADGRLTATENHILRFLSDLFGFVANQLNDIFSDITTRPIPEPSDPSRAEWWDQQHSNKQQNRENGTRAGRDNGGYGGSKQTYRRTNALAVLGLDESATSVEIKKAYRRLAQIHHPDRFTALGDESVAAATTIFKRVKEAYDYLSSNA